MSQDSDTIIKNENIINNNCQFEQIQAQYNNNNNQTSLSSGGNAYLIVQPGPEPLVTYDKVNYNAANKPDHELITKAESVRTIIEMGDIHQNISPAVSSVVTSTKTMILQSTGNDNMFHYVSTPPPQPMSASTQQPQSPPPSHQQFYTQQYTISQPSVPVHEIIDRSDEGPTALVKNDRNDNRTKLLIDAAASRFSVGIASLPPPPPPGITITTTRASSGQPLNLEHPASSTATTAIVTYGRLSYKEDILYITEPTIEIGRNSSTSTVHFHVGKNSFVSRKHLRLLHDHNDFFLMCLSKNGVFVNDVFQRKSSEPLKLPKTCTFRFPSTNIRILFESFIDYPHELPAKNNKTVENSNVIYAPLKITIPEQDKRSPFPSPTGTISAANSCPTSPRHNYQDYHHHLPIAYAYNSHHNTNSSVINNNNISSTSSSAGAISLTSSASKKIKFENDLFPPPSTSSFNEFEKPPYSYAQLIVQSISASPEKQLTLSGIYSFISKHYPYYRKEVNKGWQNSIRHNLSLNRYFIKVARSQDEPGKGSFWRIDPNSETKLIDQSYKKRRQRGSQCFRTPYGMPRSAPVSPSHMDNLYSADNSAENSPLHDIVLQSAPGSPGAYHTIHHDNHSNEDNYIASDHLFKGSSSYSQTGSSYSTGSNIGSTSMIAGPPSVVCSAGSSPPLSIKRHHVDNYQPIYEEQTAPLQLQRVINQSQTHREEYGGERVDSDENDASYEDNEDDDDDYNHTVAKRHKYEADT